MPVTSLLQERKLRYAVSHANRVKTFMCDFTERFSRVREQIPPAGYTFPRLCLIKEFKSWPLQY